MNRGTFMDGKGYDGFSKGTFRQRWFSFEGRLNRKCYIWRSLLLLGLYILILLAVNPFKDTQSIGVIISIVVFYFMALVLFITSFLSLSARRCHDVNLSGWIWSGLWILFFITGLAPRWFNSRFIPYISFAVSLAIILFAIYLLVRKGTNGTNRFGPDPLRENHT